MTTREADFTFAALQDHYRAPHGIYDALRAFDPICYDQHARCWLVTSRKAITHLLGDDRFVSHLPGSTRAPASAGSTMPSLRTLLAQQMLFFTGAAHREAHAVVQDALSTLAGTPQARQFIAAQVREVLSDAGKLGEMDAVKDFALPIAAATSGHILGLPTDNSERLLQWVEWSNAFADRTSGTAALAEHIYLLQYTFLQQVSARRESHRGDSRVNRAPAGDLLDALLAAPASFPTDQVLATNLQMLFSAGRVTAEKAMAEGVRLLAQEPHLWQHIRTTAANDGKVTQRLADEILRIVTPTRYIKRWATQDVDVSAEFPGNHLIRSGQEVVLYLEAANRDPQEFPEAHRCDPQRRPNRHLAFGYGPHLCPGAGLARLELRLALEALIRTFDCLAPLQGAVGAYAANPNLGGLLSYRVAVGTSSKASGGN